MTIGVRREILKGLKRVVIKVGSSIIAKRVKGKAGVANGLSVPNINLLAQTVLQIIDRGCEVVLVSSGAIMAGRERLDLHQSELSIPEKQACAAIGQSYLMHTYEKQFEKNGFKVAQILLSHDDLENRKRFLNAKHTLETLLEYRVVPIINENDSVTVDEIKIGDNDTLSATVTCLINAQLLIIFSDVDGLYSRDPSIKKGQLDDPLEVIEHVDCITEKIKKLAGGTNSSITVGGMHTKVLAAKQTMSFGIPTLIVNGFDNNIADKIFEGESVGTLFWAGHDKIKKRKHWIAYTLKPSGKITVGQGAHPGSGSSDAVPVRRMALADDSSYLSYQVYSDEDRTTAWTNEVASGVGYTASGSAQNMTVYGKVAAGQTGATQGSYADVLVVTVTY